MFYFIKVEMKRTPNPGCQEEGFFMKYTFEFKLGCVERYKQARMRPSARKQKQKFLQIPRPALGEPGRLDEAERKKIKGHLWMPGSLNHLESYRAIILRKSLIRRGFVWGCVSWLCDQRQLNRTSLQTLFAIQSYQEATNAYNR